MCFVLFFSFVSVYWPPIFYLLVLRLPFIGNVLTKKAVFYLKIPIFISYLDFVFLILTFNAFYSLNVFLISITLYLTFFVAL